MRWHDIERRLDRIEDTLEDIDEVLELVLQTLLDLQPATTYPRSAAIVVNKQR